MTEELPAPIVIDLMHDLQRKVHDQIMLKARIADHPKDMFRISLGSLSASLGAIAAVFSVAYGIPKSKKMGREIALAVLELGEKAESMTEAEWEAFARKFGK
jgi:hypothetical protein